MKTKIIILTAIIFLLAAFGSASAKINNNDYSPFVPVEITAKPGMPAFVKERLPQYVKDVLAHSPKPAPEATPYDYLLNDLETFNYIMGQRSGVNPLYLNGRGITFTVVVTNHLYSFPITMSEYSWENGQVIYRSGVQEIITSPEDFENIKFSWAQLIVEGAQYAAYEKFSHIRPLQVEIITKELREAGLLENGETLEEKIASHKDATIPIDHLINLAPEFQLSDFLPKHVYIQPMHMDGGMIMGMCLLQSGVLYYDPSVLVRDYYGYGDTVLHELIHNNRYLQTMIGGTFFDHEIQTSMSERSIPGYGFRWLFHPYTRPLNKIGKIISNIDADRIRYEIIRHSGGLYHLNVDSEKINEYLPKAAELQDVLGKSLTKRFYPEYYLYQLFWACVADEFYDNKAAPKTHLIFDFGLSYLGGPIPTKKQLIEHEAIVKEVYEEALRRNKAQRKTDKQENKRDITVWATPENITKHKETIKRLLPIIQIYLDTIGWKYSSSLEMFQVFYQGLNLGLISMPQILTRDIYEGKDIFPDLEPIINNQRILERIFREIENEKY